MTRSGFHLASFSIRFHWMVHPCSILRGPKECLCWWEPGSVPMWERGTSPGPFPVVPASGTSPGSATSFRELGAATSILCMARKGTSAMAQKATGGNPNVLLQGFAHCPQGAEVDCKGFTSPPCNTPGTHLPTVVVCPQLAFTFPSVGKKLEETVNCIKPNPVPTVFVLTVVFPLPRWHFLPRTICAENPERPAWKQAPLQVSKPA